jgi:hypothetical protein
MKWIWSTAFFVVAVSAALAARPAKDGDKASKTDKMSLTYTGCVKAVNHGGAFLLTHVGDHPQKPMKDDTTMKKDVMHADHMMSSAVFLTGSPDLRKHVGQRVMVTGSLAKGSMGLTQNDLDTLTVGSLKVVAKSCS